MESDNLPSIQLQATLRESITEALSSGRPLLTHLNADTTWLLSIPYPRGKATINCRMYYHILIDPWLRGSQSDVAKFFSQQWHAYESAVQTIAEVEDAIRGIEEVSSGSTAQINQRSNGNDDNDDMDYESSAWIDAVVVSHEFTDHMHKETLLEIDPHVPIFATSKAASSIRSWRHFSLVADIPLFTTEENDWRNSSRSPLPNFIGISKLAYPGADLLYYHSAIMVAFPSGDREENGEAEAVIYTPHGLSPNDCASVAKAQPPVKTLALLHGLHDISLGSQAQLNLGAHNGLKLQRLLRSKYWIPTHDEVKRGGGLVSWMLNRQVITLQEAIKREIEERGVTVDGSALASMAGVHFEEVGNGESLILN